MSKGGGGCAASCGGSSSENDEKTPKDEYDDLFNRILRNTVFSKLTKSEVNKLSLTFDQHIALLNLGNNLQKKGIFIKYALTDWRRSKDSFVKKRAKDIDEHGIDLIGFTSTTPDYPDVIEIAQAIKKERPNVKIIVGGCHPTFMPQEILKESPMIDYIACGPGDNVLLKLASRVELSEIEGLAYRNNGDIHVNRVKENNPELLGISYPFDYDAALGPGRKFPLARVFSRLGCNKNCHYCADRVWRKQIHEVNIDQLRQEIHNLYHFRGTRYFYLHTEDVLSCVDHFKSVADIFLRLREQDDRVHYSVQVTAAAVNKTSDEDLIALGQTGLNWFQIGLESIDPAVNAKSNPKSFEVALKKLKRCVPHAYTTVYLLTGLPGDSYDLTMKTMEYVEKLSEQDLVTAVFMGIFIPYPATRVYWEQKKYHIKVDDSDWRKFGYVYLTPPYEYEDWEAEDIYYAYKDALSYACKILEKKVKQLGLDGKAIMPFYDVV